jgi:hypothetical protein
LSWIVDNARWDDYRDALSIGYIEYAASTLAHELGHTHGLLHSPGCYADAPDPNTPYISHGIGYIGWAGWDNRRPLEFLSSTTTANIMTYCDPAWMSDYVYARVSDRVEAVNRLNAYRRLTKPETHTYRVLNVSENRAKWGRRISKPREAQGTVVTARGLDRVGIPVGQLTVYRTYRSTDVPSAAYWIPEPLPNYVAIEVDGIQVRL